jgi:hypothetical protein
LKMSHSPFFGFAYYGFVHGWSSKTFTYSSFCALYPSTMTTPPNEYKYFKKDDRLFSFNAVPEHHFRRWLRFLQTKEFGFIDMMGYLLPHERFPDGSTNKNVIDSRFLLTTDNIYNWLNNLYVMDETIEKHHQKLSVGSKLDSDFHLTLFSQNTPSPQEATDIGVYYYQTKEDISKLDVSEINSKISSEEIKILTTVGYKKRSPEIKIKLSEDEEISVLTIGCFGALYGAGEHLEKDETAYMRGLVEQFKKDKRPVVLKNNDKVSSRGIAEECGIVLDDKPQFRGIIGVHDKRGRDPRYVGHHFDGFRFGGLDRESSSVLVNVFVKINDASKDIVIKDPTDYHECSKPKVITLNKLLEEFNEDGKLSPAFLSHVEQLEMTRAALPTVLKTFC